MQQATITTQLQELVSAQVPQQRLWTGINVALIPITAAMGVLPGPNLFLVYNAFRLYSRWRALKGGQFLRTALSPPTTGDASSSLSPASSSAVEVRYQPSDDLAQLVPSDPDTVLSEDAIRRIAELYGSHEMLHQLLRSRQQFASS